MKNICPIKNRAFYQKCSLLLAFSLLSGCALFVKPPEPTIEKLSAEEVNSYAWEDDQDYEGMSLAVQESIRYYSRLSPSRRFNYGGTFYSPEEMTVSLTLFLNIIRSFQGEERMKHLREKFLFFESRNIHGDAFFTGYYEPVLDGGHEPTGELRTPVYATPEDLVEADLGQFREQWKNETIYGRIEGKRFIPYDSREEIMYKESLKDRAEPLAYVNEIELFFLQIQGSGLIRFPDGSLTRINYASQNGLPYRAIGKFLKDRIPADEMSMQSIKAYLYENPDNVRKILSYNPSYTFFRKVDQGPLGDIEVPLTPGRSIAMDRRSVPRGGLAFIETKIPVFKNKNIMEWKSLKRFVLVQDTGGAIRDHGRVDIFFGNGEDAEMIAGHMKQNGRTFLIVARKEFLKHVKSRNTE